MRWKQYFLRSRCAARVPASGERRRRVGLLLGCVQRVFFDEVNRATIRVLAAEGCEVVIPKNQGCCGALMLHTGLEEDAADMARRFIDTFEVEAADVDTIVINAAGCGSTLKEYGHLLRDDPAYADRAQVLANKCKDISELLAELPPRAPRHPLPLSIAYHDACHLRHAQGIVSEPRQVLETIPKLDIHEIPEAAVCCGSAGIYNLVEPETASRLGDRKAQQIGAPRKPYHLIELVDASIQGLTP